MVATTLITISSTGQGLESVVLLSALVGNFSDIEDGGSGNLVGGETTLAGSLSCEGSGFTEKVGVFLEELVGGAEVVNGVLANLLLDDDEVVHGVEVVFVSAFNNSYIILSKTS